MTEPTKINDQISVAAQITLDDLAAFKKAGYATVMNNRPDNEEPGQLDHLTAESEAKKQGLNYVYLPIVSSAISRPTMCRTISRAVVSAVRQVPILRPSRITLTRSAIASTSSI